ncbi:M24 family metallopeptidase [Hoyosella rhizosphaerae]|uniref:M24 family metallopeptidase n=1 Tax=Hoyosella rhizosphaerae TaxID=1755582 RepID=UPI001E5AF4DE|nr:Xaa-Pro peptidase family protein [Hoyosella rhizosphaerae]
MENKSLATDPHSPGSIDVFARRRGQLRAEIEAQGADALLVTSTINVRYLTGFTGSHAALLVMSGAIGGDHDAILSTDGRYTTQVQQQAPNVHVEFARLGSVHLAQHAAAVGLRRVAFESHVTTVALFNKIAAVGENDSTTIEWIPTEGAVEQLRCVKDELEIRALSQACAVGDAALADVLAQGVLRPGVTERFVARALENLIYDHGGQAVAFETIVAAGAHSAIPHHRPTDSVIAPGDFVKIDFGAVVDGYHSDMTRTFVVGAPASDWQREIYEVVRRAQEAGCAAAVEGASTGSVDAAARAVIEGAGYGKFFVHSTGHGVGLEIHEAPSVAKNADSRLRCKTAITVEPGIYLPGRGGVRIEDTLVVSAASEGTASESGGPELLTKTSKQLTVV